MASLPRRDPTTDQLLTPENCVLIVIDYQPLQIQTVRSMDQDKLVGNITLAIDAAVSFRVPVVLSSVNVKRGLEGTIPQIKKLLPENQEIDRTSINAWEDAEFVAAVKALNRKNLIFSALWTEACLTFPALDAIKEGYNVYALVDTVGGTSALAHEAAIARIQQAGVRQCTIAQLVCELQRDWNRRETAGKLANFLGIIEGAQN